MANHDDAYVQALREAVLSGAGVTSAELRGRIAARSGRLGEAAPEDGLPDVVARFVDAVREGAEGADVGELRSAGHDDDAVFEVTVAAAVGAGLARLARVRALMAEADGAARASAT
jgi:hypothetical protein